MTETDRSVAASDVISTLRSDGDMTARYQELLARDDREEILAEMAKSGDPLIRMWVAGIVPELLGKAGGDLVLRLMKDRDSDVRGLALQSLAAIDPVAARGMLPKITKRLWSKEYYEPIDALWTLAALGDTRAIPEIERARPALRPWQARVSEMVVAVLQHDDAAIVARIRGHDHVDMARLARAASLLRSAGVRRALEDVASDPEMDRYCRDAAVKALADISASEARSNANTTLGSSDIAQP